MVTQELESGSHLQDGIIIMPVQMKKADQKKNKRLLKKSTRQKTVTVPEQLALLL